MPQLPLLAALLFIAIYSSCGQTGEANKILEEYFSNEVVKEVNSSRYLLARPDLNEDDRADYVVLMQSPYFCGTGGCNLLIVDGRKHQVVFDFTGCSKPAYFIHLGNGQVILKYNRQGGGLPQSWQYYALNFKEPDFRETDSSDFKDADFQEIIFEKTPRFYLK